MQTEEKQMKMSYLIKLCTVYQKIQMDTDATDSICVTDNGL